MSKEHAKDTYLALGDPNNADTLTDFSTYLNQAALARQRGTAETTGFRSTGSVRSYVAGLRNGTISVSGIWDGASGAIDEVLDALYNDDDPASWRLGPGGNATGAKGYEGGANGGGSAGEGVLLTDYTVTSGLEDAVAFSAEFQVTGAINNHTFA